MVIAGGTVNSINETSKTSNKQGLDYNLASQ